MLCVKILNVVKINISECGVTANIPVLGTGDSGFESRHSDKKVISMARQAHLQQIPAFKKTIWAYYAKNKRDFPWRNTTDPYSIVVSEVMLQQTQTFRVVDKYLAFIKAFPTFNALHVAPLGEVLKLWQGLGYNRRAINLKKLATEVVEKHGGKLPQTREELDALPGIGEATAASIAAFAFNIPYPFIETNIRRVFIHFFFPRARLGVSDDKLLLLVEATLDKKRAREWYYALMDYGAMLPKVVTNPNRKSKHYTKQSTFKGSNREIRGAVLRAVTKAGKMNVEGLIHEIASEFGERFDEMKVRAAIETLIEEGFFKMVNRDIVA